MWEVATGRRPRWPATVARVGTQAEFEEKQFEGAFNVELGRRAGVFPSGQVLEKLTGYDSAADPDDTSEIWRILRTPRPDGVRLVPEVWGWGPRDVSRQSGKLPTFPVSLILQYKRPERLVGASSPQYKYWNGPYWRFTRDAAQHKQLRKLERHAGASAAVVYASPAFHQFRQLEESQLRGEVIASTNFVRPIGMGRHAHWTYDSPGTVGRGNPDGDEVDSREIFDALFARNLDNPRSELVVLNDLLAHLAILAEGCALAAPTLARSVDQWVRNLGAYSDFDERNYPGLRDYAVVQSTVAHWRGSWWIVDPYGPRIL